MRDFNTEAFHSKAFKALTLVILNFRNYSNYKRQ